MTSRASGDRLHMIRSVAAMGTVAMLAAGCSAGREAGAGSAAERFSQLVEARDFAGACELLAPRTRAEAGADGPCEEALAEESLGSLGASPATRVYGRHAQVRGAAETIFLAEFAGEWRVVAVGCEARQDEPYDCAVTGG